MYLFDKQMFTQFNLIFNLDLKIFKNMKPNHHFRYAAVCDLRKGYIGKMGILTGSVKIKIPIKITGGSYLLYADLL